MTNTDLVATEIMPLGGATNSKLVLGFINSGTKGTQNDTLTVTNASAVSMAIATTDADGVADPCTLSTNVITLTSATGTAGSLLIVYRKV